MAAAEGMHTDLTGPMVTADTVAGMADTAADMEDTAVASSSAGGRTVLGMAANTASDEVLAMAGLVAAECAAECAAVE